LKTFLVILISYLLGSISFGYIVANMWKGIDLRKVGSGNIGTTNVARTLGFKYAVLVFIGDALKGIIAVLIARKVGGPYLEVIAGLVAILGHTWPIFLKFKGGKGIATGAGLIIALVPKVAVISVSLWVLITLITRYVSLASIIAAISVPILTIIFYGLTPYLFFGIPAAIFVTYKHIPNIKRLLEGKEYKFGQQVK
jgi:acyl phosphate:glycerol-3-phosphate acyltransferase